MSPDSEYNYCALCRAWFHRYFGHKHTNTTGGTSYSSFVSIDGGAVLDSTPVPELTARLSHSELQQLNPAERAAYAREISRRK